MYLTEDGKKLFVIDGHAHFWDARPENRANRYGLTFIETFWNAHNGPFKASNMLANMNRAIEARQKEMGGRQPK